MLNQWERSIVDRLRYGLQNRQAVTLGADEVHIAMNAIEERDELRERCKAAEVDIHRGCSTCANRGNRWGDNGQMKPRCLGCSRYADPNKQPWSNWVWRGPQAQATGEGEKDD